jgi:hypothetical protein
VDKYATSPDLRSTPESKKKPLSCPDSQSVVEITSGRSECGGIAIALDHVLSEIIPSRQAVFRAAQKVGCPGRRSYS